jgi:predicted nucleic acid-binding protein
MEIICLDTHILIWGIKKDATEGQEHMVPIAESFIKSLDEERKIKVMVPSVVIGELLMRVPPEKHEEVNRLFYRRFMVPSYDIAAASCFARIWQEKKNVFPQLKEEFPDSTREELKADCQIVAIAVTHGARCIYSYDEKLTRFANGYIEVRKMPEAVEQMSVLSLL